MNTTAQSIRVGLFFIFGVALIYVMWDTLDNRGATSRNTYTLRADFKDLRTLKSGDEVRMAGVRIGNVSSVGLDGSRAYAKMRIEQSFRIPADSVATINTVGLLGNNYISITPGTDTATLAANSTIKTTEGADLNTLIAQMSDIGSRVDDVLGGLQSTLGGGESGDLFANLNALIEENRQRINDTLTNFEKISAQIAGGEGTLGKLLTDDTAYVRLLATADDISGAAKGVQNLTDEAESIFAAIKDGQGALGVLLYDDQIGDNLRMTVANITDFSAKLNNDDSTIGRLLTDDSLYFQATETLRKVDHAVDSLDDSGPITAVGVLANGLF